VQVDQAIDAQRVSDLQFDLELMIAQKNASAVSVAPASASDTPPTSAAASSAVASATAAHTGAPQPQSATAQEPAAPFAEKRWQISFRPYRELFARGNDPLRMIRELAELGDLIVSVDAIALPVLSELEPTECHLAWTLELAGDVDEEAIRQVFEWAEGDCELMIGEIESGSSAVAEAGAASGASADDPFPDTIVLPASTPALAAKTDGAAKADSPPKGDNKAEGQVTPIGDTGSIRVSVEKIDELMNTVGELVITQAMLSQLGTQIEGDTAEQLRAGLAQLERNMRELQESVMRVRMLPISFVFSRFPRMVRDLAQRLGKQIELKLTGEQTELDKTVLEKIGDPLVHLVRNSIDHGIESPEVRAAAGKPAFGTVHLDACHRGGNIAVEVSDDGAGLDKDRILAKGRARGLVGANEQLTDEQIYELIFLPGFSTADKTTDLSGRGVGMDVVRRNVKELGGKVELRTERGKGSRFVITLPLTLAIVDGQSVAVGSETYIVPLISIVESMQLKTSNVSRLSGRGEVFSFRGDYLPIIRLHELYGVEPHTRNLHEGLVVVAEGEGRRVGLFVDDLLGQQQVVIKSLEANYGHVEGVSGATILGDGSVALILDVPGIIRAASVRAVA